MRESRQWSFDSGRLCRDMLLGVILASRLFAAEPQSAADPQGMANDGVVVDEADQTWLDPEWAAADECPAEGTGMVGWLAHRLPHYSARHIGWGAPLENTSWLNRRFYVGGFLGESFGGTLVADEYAVQPSLFGGLWLGYDLSHYWGSEIRLGLNYADIEYVPTGATYDNSRNALLDVNLLYYPWGDSRWRPYGAVGLGFGGFHFGDYVDDRIDHTGFSVPVGLGVKYLWGKQIALRLDAKDNLILGGHDVGTTNNWSLTAGFELHWGSGAAPLYTPW